MSGDEGEIIALNCYSFLARVDSIIVFSSGPRGLPCLGKVVKVRWPHDCLDKKAHYDVLSESKAWLIADVLEEDIIMVIR